MRSVIRYSGSIAAILFLLLSLLVFVPRALFGAPRQDWLTLSLCRVPCWRNITPGVTIFRQGRALLNRMPDVQPITPVMTNSSRGLTGGFLLTIRGEQAYGAIFTITPAFNSEDGIITNISFNNLLTTRLIDVVNQVGAPYRAGAIREQGRGVLLMFDFQDRHMAALASISETTLERLCMMGFEQTPIDYIILHDGVPRSYPGTRWRGYDALTLELCER